MDATRATWRRKVSRHLSRIGRRTQAEIVDPPEMPGADWLLAEDDAPDALTATAAPDVTDSRDVVIEPSSSLSDASLAALVMELEITEGELVSGPPRRAGDEFVELMRETYPSVAELIVTLASEDPGEHVQEWLEVARALSDAKRTRSGTLKTEARERALCVAIAHATEAQARSSARIAGWTDAQLDDLWEPADPHRPGQHVWEHYLCREAELIRATLHGEAVGTWLGALGDLWEAANHLLELLDAKYYEGLGADRKTARMSLRATLVNVNELALW